MFPEQFEETLCVVKQKWVCCGGDVRKAVPRLCPASRQSTPVERELAKQKYRYIPKSTHSSCYITSVAADELYTPSLIFLHNLISVDNLIPITNIYLKTPLPNILLIVI